MAFPPKTLVVLKYAENREEVHEDEHRIKSEGTEFVDASLNNT